MSATTCHSYTLLDTPHLHFKKQMHLIAMLYLTPHLTQTKLALLKWKVHLLSIATLYLTPHVLQWPDDPPGQCGCNAGRQQWANQWPLELLGKVSSAWIHRYEESWHQAHGSDPSYAKTLRTYIFKMLIINWESSSCEHYRQTFFFFV